jgi:hypothetical protein
MGAGRTERRGTLKSIEGPPLNNGSRQRAVESYIFGSQPSVENDITREVGGPRDVKTPAQVSKKTSVVRGESGRSEDLRIVVNHGSRLKRI